MMEDYKTTIGDRPHTRDSRHKQKWRIVLTTGLLIFSLWLLNPFEALLPDWRPTSPIFDQAKVAFSWSDISPSRTLKYTPCYEDFQCARLDVPLNWNATDRDNGPRAVLAIVKLPAKVPVTDEQYGGPIIMNPGGPGESGAHLVLSGGKHIQTILDSPSGKSFDILSFDPRGVNNTTPRLKCFPDPFNQQSWIMKYPDYGLLWDSESVIGLEWARAQALGASCQAENGEEGILRYLTTAQTAEDMLEIVERHGEWRENEAKRIALCSNRVPNSKDVLERIAWNKGQEKIQFWGMSYGTLLGQTFAAMHPDRIDRLVIDSVLDPDDYYRGDWLKNLQDSDEIITQFCSYCHQAGPENCPLYIGSSGADVEARLDRIMQSLKSHPVPIPSDGTRGPEIITYGDMLLRMLTAMYFPSSAAEPFFHELADLESGNGTALAITKQTYLQAVAISPQCQHDGPFSEACIEGHYVSGVGAFQAVSCMDAGGVTGLTREGFAEYLVELKGQGRWISTSWARNKLACVGYSVAPAWRFEGPIEGNTSHPMLIIGNTHDTVCPIRNAHHVAALFPGSVVLNHESEGHCSYSNPSICTGKALRKYFDSGKLPEKGTVCSPYSKPFIGCLDKDEHGDCAKINKKDEEMWGAMKAITEIWP